MGNVERCDKTLPLNEMIFHVRRDAALREGKYTDAIFEEITRKALDPLWSEFLSSRR